MGLIGREDTLNLPCFSFIYNNLPSPEWSDRWIICATLHHILTFIPYSNLKKKTSLATACSLSLSLLQLVVSPDGSTLLPGSTLYREGRPSSSLQHNRWVAFSCLVWLDSGRFGRGLWRWRAFGERCWWTPGSCWVVALSPAPQWWWQSPFSFFFHTGVVHQEHNHEGSGRHRGQYELCTGELGDGGIDLSMVTFEPPLLGSEDSDYRDSPLISNTLLYCKCYQK